MQRISYLEKPWLAGCHHGSHGYVVAWTYTFSMLRCLLPTSNFNVSTFKNAPTVYVLSLLYIFFSSIISGNSKCNSPVRANTLSPHLAHEHIYTTLLSTWTLFEHVAQFYNSRETSKSSPSSSDKDLLGVTCNCGHFVVYKPCLTNKNGNQGCLAVVSVKYSC